MARISISNKENLDKELIKKAASDYLQGNQYKSLVVDFDIKAGDKENIDSILNDFKVNTCSPVAINNLSKQYGANLKALEIHANIDNSVCTKFANDALFVMQCEKLGGDISLDSCGNGSVEVSGIDSGFTAVHYCCSN
ncbi:MAG: hypothetical protein AABY27_05925 [Pseudomonadota bacterium]